MTKSMIGLALATVLGALGTAPPASAGGLVRAEGTFTVAIDFPTLTLTPVDDESCLLEVEGVVTFTGTLEGIAPSRTRALAAAPCEFVARNPPGAYEDVFTAALEFAGEVDGRPVVADLTYRGDTAIGGHVDGVMVASNGLRGRLSVDGIVAAGGTYKGFLIVTDR